MSRRRRRALIASFVWLIVPAAAPVSAQPTAPPAPPTAPTSTAPAPTAPAPTAPATSSASAPAAATTTATTGTAAAPATTAAAHDFSTPKATVRSLAIAMQSGDRAVILAVLHANNPTESRLATVMADLAEAMAALSRNAVTAFGEEGARPLTGESTEAAEALQRLDAATVREDDHVATVGGDKNDPGVTLAYVNGQWKLPVSAMIAGVDEAAVAQRLTDVEAQVQLFTELASE